MAKGQVKLTSIHFLLSYKCTSECDHCFIWGSPQAIGTFSTEQIERVLRQAKDIDTITRIYFEGGEPFLFYPVLVKGVELARRMEFEVGIVSNGYWATDKKDAISWLEPLARQGIADLSISKDEYHGTKDETENAKRAYAAAKKLKMPVGMMDVRGLEFYQCEPTSEVAGGELMFRGRAAKELASKVRQKPWSNFTSCPEEPPKISRVHVDSYGNVQFCQGISIGNLWRKPLKKIIADFDPEKHPIIGPLTRGGPVRLARELRMKPRRTYADACHMCYDLRVALRQQGRLSRTLTPDQAYGEGLD